MKTLAAIVLVYISMISTGAYGCDETCKREKAQAEKNLKFPSYLTWNYCEGIAMDFMTSAMRSLDNYRTNHIKTKYKGPMKNTRHFVVQRKEWLKECDVYMSATGKGRIFDNDKTTKKIFASMDKVTKEFDDLIAGVSYSTGAGEDPNAVMKERLNTLMETVDNHKSLMHLKGKIVFR